jgi:hypothetical protein
MLPSMPSFHVTMMLADAAQVSENKINLLGGGWELIGPQIGPTAVALLIRVPWDMTNTKQRWALELVDSDGEAVTLTTPLGHEEPVKVEGEFEVGRPPGVPKGVAFQVPLAITFGPLPVEPGGRYEWRLTIGKESDEGWRLPFSVRPNPPNG